MSIKSKRRAPDASVVDELDQPIDQPSYAEFSKLSVNGPNYYGYKRRRKLEILFARWGLDAGQHEDCLKLCITLAAKCYAGFNDRIEKRGAKKTKDAVWRQSLVKDVDALKATGLTTNDACLKLAKDKKYKKDIIVSAGNAEKNPDQSRAKTLSRAYRLINQELRDAEAMLQCFSAPARVKKVD